MNIGGEHQFDFAVSAHHAAANEDDDPDHFIAEAPLPVLGQVTTVIGDMISSGISLKLAPCCAPTDASHYFTKESVPSHWGPNPKCSFATAVQTWIN